MEDYRRCLLLDNNYMAKNIISTERAFVICYKGNATVIHEHPETFGLVNPELEIFKPSVIKVKNFIGYHRKVALTRENVFRRDNYECAYCPPGTYHRKDFLTIDHVLPISKGGKNTWDNMVTACKTCNGLKADLLVDEFTKHVPHPKRPHYLMLLHAINYIPEEWKPYLFLD